MHMYRQAVIMYCVSSMNLAADAVLKHYVNVTMA